MPKELKRSVCPYDCPDVCGLLVEVEEGRALKVAGDPEHPHTRGFLCPKMNRYQETVHSLRRLTTPPRVDCGTKRRLWLTTSWGKCVSF
ncbi:MAG: hypothetical protein RBR25_05105 [Trichloromonas sp.]|nr:hypothetical protein [Trichloromonas sp.]